MKVSKRLLTQVAHFLRVEELDILVDDRFIVVSTEFHSDTFAQNVEILGTESNTDGRNLNESVTLVISI